MELKMSDNDGITPTNSSQCSKLVLCGTPDRDYIVVRNAPPLLQNFVSAKEGDDTIVATGSTTIAGGKGADTFAIEPDADFIWITDFEKGEGDKIDLTEFGGLSFARLKETATPWDEGGTDNPTLTLYLPNGGRVMLENVTVDQLDSSTFLFAPARPDLF